MEPTSTPFVAGDEERSLVKSALVGIVGGMIGFGLLTLLVVKLGWPDQSWGFTLTIAGFSAMWAGVFFGSAAGVAYYQASSKSHEFTADEAHVAPIDVVTMPTTLAHP